MPPKASISEHFKGYFILNSGKRNSLITYSKTLYRNSLFFATNQEKTIVRPGPLWSIYRRRDDHNPDKWWYLCFQVRLGYWQACPGPPSRILPCPGTGHGKNRDFSGFHILHPVFDTIVPPIGAIWWFFRGQFIPNPAKLGSFQAYRKTIVPLFRELVSKTWPRSPGKAEPLVVSPSWRPDVWEDVIS